MQVDITSKVATQGNFINNSIGAILSRGIYGGLAIVLIAACADVLLDVLGTVRHQEESWPGYGGFVISCIYSIAIAPLLETWFFQYLIIEMIGRNSNSRSAIGVFVSTVAFAVIHLQVYGSRVGIIAILVGATLACIYMQSSKLSRLRGFSITWLAHTTNNLIACIVQLYCAVG